MTSQDWLVVLCLLGLLLVVVLLNLVNRNDRDIGPVPLAEIRHIEAEIAQHPERES